MRLVTKDDTRIVAESASREAGNVTVFQNGWFTPCKVCEDNPDKPPTWRIRAKTIIHRKDQATITYQQRLLRLLRCADRLGAILPKRRSDGEAEVGIPHAEYTPVRQARYDRARALLLRAGGHYDFTFAPMFTTKAGTAAARQLAAAVGERRLRIDLHGVFDDGTFTMPGGEDFRGSIETQGKFALNPYWAWGWDITARSDEHLPSLL